MIDKELIRQAAEDIDLFEDDLSAEFDRLSQPSTRTFRLWPYVAAACIALLLAVGISVRLLTSNPNSSSNLVFAQEITSEDTAPVHGSNIAQTNATMEEKLIGNTIAPAPQTLAMTSAADSQKTEEVLQKEDEYSEALLYALITEVEAKAIAEQAEEERLYRTLLDEISTNISKEINQTELTL